MVSGVGFTELLLLFVIGLLILGPERLPRVASQLGRWVGKARRTANQLRFQMEREIALADIEKTKKKTKTRPPAASAGTDETKTSTSTEAVGPGNTGTGPATNSGTETNAPVREPAAANSDADKS